MEQEKLEEYENVGDYLFQVSYSDLNLDLRKEARDGGLAIKALVEEVRRLQETSVDTVSELAVGDEVVSLLDYMELRKGMKGKVVRIAPTAEYPVEVKFDGVQFMYLTNGVLGLKRNELGKVNG